MINTNIGSAITDAAARLKGLKEKANETKAKRKEVRGIRKDQRTQLREKLREVRQNKDLSNVERRAQAGGARAFHKVDREGNVGGFKAFGEFAKKFGDREQARAGRVQAREDRQAARVERREARPAAQKAAARQEARQTHKDNIAYMKEKKASGTLLKNDLQFFKHNAKLRGMKLPEYYAKYVK